MQKKISILFVDDDAAMARLGHELFNLLELNATITTSSLKALEMFTTNPMKFDLVITDYDMPNLKGDSLAKKLKRIRNNIPIILSTGNKNISLEDIQDWGIDELLIKPYFPGEIDTLIQKMVPSND